MSDDAKPAGSAEFMDIDVHREPATFVAYGKPETDPRFNVSVEKVEDSHMIGFSIWHQGARLHMTTFLPDDDRGEWSGTFQIDGTDGHGHMVRWEGNDRSAGDFTLDPMPPERPS